MSLAEALEVRGGPLQEEEIWAVLNQSAESLQELFRKGKCVCGGRGGWVAEKQLLWQTVESSAFFYLSGLKKLRSSLLSLEHLMYAKH